MIGSSAPMTELASRIARFAPLNSNVLIEGESGTGKELVAEALHEKSARAGAPFIAVNCAAIPDALLESEFFGHERGSFTGAVSQEKGKFEQADGGTLFLDEIGELSLSMQPKLLRALERRTVDRIGGKRSITVDIRVIAATNRDLEREVAAGRFREDLYYRLNVLHLRTPPLRERREDIPVLVQHFLLQFANKAARGVISISAEAESILENYHWPGNVRQLQNVMEYAVAISNTEIVMPEHLPTEVFKRKQTPPANFEVAVEEFKNQFLTQAVAMANGNCTKAAKLIGLHPKTVQRHIRVSS